nr:lipoprotein [bacterium]
MKKPAAVFLALFMVLLLSGCQAISGPSAPPAASADPTPAATAPLQTASPSVMPSPSPAMGYRAAISDGDYQAALQVARDYYAGMPFTLYSLEAAKDEDSLYARYARQPGKIIILLAGTSHAEVPRRIALVRQKGEEPWQVLEGSEGY